MEKLFIDFKKPNKDNKKISIISILNLGKNSLASLHLYKRSLVFRKPLLADCQYLKLTPPSQPLLVEIFLRDMSKSESQGLNYKSIKQKNSKNV